MTFRTTTLLCGAVALAGCPLILGGPDLSNVSRATDADIFLDTAGLTGTSETGTSSTDTSTETADPRAPLILHFSLLAFVDALGFSFVVADSDGDLLGGKVDVTDGQNTHTLSIPTDLVKFDSDGTSTAQVDATGLFGCDLPYSDRWELVVSDLAGRRSPPVEAEVHLTTRGMLPDQQTPYDLGDITPPTLFCVQFQGVYSDSAVVRFEVPTDGTYTFQFGWPDQPMDGDMWLYQVGEPAPIQASANINLEYESVTADLEAGIRYRLDLFWYGGIGTPPYEARVVIRQH